MKVKCILALSIDITPLQIHWHDKQPIYSAHFESGPKGRLATAGGDGNVRIWRVVKDKEKDSTQIEFLSSLNRHTAAVNVVRFSPTGECLASAGDDGNIILWKPSETKEAANRFADSDDEEEHETWRVQSMMRGSLSDIYDLAWSPDGRYIISGSIDNTARIWDVKDAKCIHVITDHHHYVQGVAWDPLGEFVATQSSDRSVNIYSFKVNKSGFPSVSLLGKSTKLEFSKIRPSTKESQASGTSTTSATVTAAAASTAVSSSKASGEVSETTSESTEKEEPSKQSKPSPKSFRIYHDETLTSFFRRLSFTPDGSMLIAPAGQYKTPPQKSATSKDEDNQSTTQTSEQETKNTAFIYARRDFSKGPIAHLPGQKKPSVAIKCSPVLYELRQIQCSKQSTQSKEKDINRNGVTPPTLEEKKQPSMFGLGYRSVYAVATQDSVLIYDTQQSTALALVSHLHYATFTDMAWSSDGCNLILTSSDGFCSIISFDEGELGTVYTPSESMMALLSANSAKTAQSESADSAASIAATAGMLQKLNGLSLAEQKEQKEQKAKPKSEKGASSEGKKSATKSKPKAPSASRPTQSSSTLTPSPFTSSASPASTSSSSTPTLTQTKILDPPTVIGKTERDGDLVMTSASDQPTPKKRRIQPTFVSALPGSSTNPPSNSNSSETPPPKKRIQPIFVSALPGR